MLEKPGWDFSIGILRILSSEDYYVQASKILQLMKQYFIKNGSLLFFERTVKQTRNIVALYYPSINS